MVRVPTAWGRGASPRPSASRVEAVLLQVGRAEAGVKPHKDKERALLPSSSRHTLLAGQNLQGRWRGSPVFSTAKEGGLDPGFAQRGVWSDYKKIMDLDVALPFKNELAVFLHSPSGHG